MDETKTKPDARRLKLECVDCHVGVDDEYHRALETMLRHTRSAHGRDLVFGRDFYRRPDLTANDHLASIALLRPELILCG